LTADHTQSIEIASELREANNKLESLSEKVGAARTVKSLASDRRKNLLAKHMKGYLNAGDSTAKAEFMARASDEFLEEFDSQGDQLEAAEVTISQYETAEKLLESRRSLLSHSKTIHNDLQG